MSGGIRSVFLLTMAAGVISGCGGDRVTTSMAPEADPLAEGVNPAARQGHAGQPLGKLAIDGNMTQAVVVAIVKQGWSTAWRRDGGVVTFGLGFSDGFCLVGRNRCER